MFYIQLHCLPCLNKNNRAPNEIVWAIIACVLLLVSESLNLLDCNLVDLLYSNRLFPANPRTEPRSGWRSKTRVCSQAWARTQPQHDFPLFTCKYLLFWLQVDCFDIFCRTRRSTSGRRDSVVVLITHLRRRVLRTDPLLCLVQVVQMQHL